MFSLFSDLQLKDSVAMSEFFSWVEKEVLHLHGRYHTVGRELEHGIESKKGLSSPVVTITSETTISWHFRSKISKK